MTRGMSDLAERDGDTVSTAPSTASEASTHAVDSGTFSIATWNIRNGRNGGLESACRALDSLGVDLALLQETKLTGGIHTRFSSGYTIVASDAPSAHQGGIALCSRESLAYELEETKIWSPNVIAFRLITGGAKFYVVGCYIPPSDLVALDHVRDAWRQCPKGFTPLLLGDLNINLESPRDERDEVIAEQCDDSHV